MVAGSGDRDDPAGAMLAGVEAELRVLTCMVLSAGDGVLAEGIPGDWTVTAETPVDKGAVEEATLSGVDRDEEDCAALGDVPAGNAVALPFGEDEGVAEG